MPAHRRERAIKLVILVLILLSLIGEAMRDSSLRRAIVGYLLLLVTSLVALMFLLVALFSVAHARDFGQWEATDPAIRHWYETLMQPDNPAVSCCGEADAYWADSYEVSPNGEYIAIITDDRPDEPLKRRHLDIGTRIVVPKHKLKYDQSNPTGHGIIFTTNTLYVYCYVAPGGV